MIQISLDIERHSQQQQQLQVNNNNNYELLDDILMHHHAAARDPIDIDMAFDELNDHCMEEYQGQLLPEAASYPVNKLRGSATGSISLMLSSC
jgi:hypothetical protein